ncbi:Fusaric acid resistance protein-like-domain-containing protein [Gymnopilus junonius]|uniref:Fusaric acid resistance protein-like-domain-containing protein n=1 Tax=Gymnopilus junonius TaxID=109634 RepID=A0A9P5NWV6_GYMJU|nr:Fusaric acid resistance protein-like-domain-containing protein [Gymnopilus junonius]
MENEGHLSPNSSIGRRNSHFFVPHDTRTPTSTASSIIPGRQNFQEEPCASSSAQRVEDLDDHSPTGPPAQALKQYFLSFLDIFSLPLIWRNVLKCAIAYLLASLFTFSPGLSQIISGMNLSGPSASGHLVATIVVYFNPAKTVGAMVEADMFCLFGLLYAAVVCLVSMSMFWWFEVQPGWEWLADSVALAWIGFSVGTLAWMKLWMENPSFNTGKTMTSIIIFLVIIKEGGLGTLLQVSGMIVCGSLVANLICYLLWPQSAITNLQLSMIKTLDSFSTLLPMLTRIFLLENETSIGMDMDEIQRAIENHQNSFTTLKKNLREAKSEWILSRIFGGEPEAYGTSGEHPGKQSYEDAVDSLNRLAQHLNGLRSSTRLQHDLMKASNKRQASKLTGQVPESELDEDDARLEAAAAMFDNLVDELGPPLKALSSTSTSTLHHLRDVCVTSRQKKGYADTVQPHEWSDLVAGIEAALVRFESTSNHAVLRLYRRSVTSSPILPMISPNQFTTSHLLSKRSPDTDHESVFLVYFFIFTLQEFAKELMLLVDAIERIYSYEQHVLHRPSWWTKLSSLLQSSAAYFSLSPHIIPYHRMRHPAFPKILPHAPDTIQTPPRNELSLLGKLNQSMWAIGKRLKERDTRYAIKVGIATAVLAFPAFANATRPTFVDYWGDWALISFFVVISPTIGATNFMSFQRLLGTLFGAAVAAGLYSLFPEDPVALSIAGFVFSLPCFYFAVSKPKYLSASRFVLLTYNLTCLFCYHLRQKDASVIGIAFHRAIAVTAGILWAVLVSRFWWPSEARRELTKSLSEFCLHIGWLYTRLVASNSFTVGDVDQSGSSTGLTNSIHEFMAMELHLQLKLIELQNLLSQAQHEPRLKGPFPVDLYRQILASLQTILDKLHSMRCVTTREEWYTTVRKDFIIPVNRERREMVGNIMLSFSFLSASFRLKAPLPPYLPPVEEARLKLVDAIRKLDVVRNRDVKVSRQLLFFAYALTMKGVTMELEFLGRTLQNAFGVIGQTPEEFEQLFVPLQIEGSHAAIDHVA